MIAARIASTSAALIIQRIASLAITKKIASRITPAMMEMVVKDMKVVGDQWPVVGGQWSVVSL